MLVNSLNPISLGSEVPNSIKYTVIPLFIKYWLISKAFSWASLSNAMYILLTLLFIIADFSLSNTILPNNGIEFL